MKKLAAFSVVALLAAAFLAAFASMAHAQSLGDLANKEKERRTAVKNDRVITEDEASKYRSASEPAKEPEKTAAQSASEKTDGEAAGAVSSKEKAAESDEPVDFQGRTESYWRKTMSEARQNVKNLENESNVLALKLNSLQDLFYKEADGYRRETVQREIQKTYYEQDLNKQKLEKAKTTLQELENEARKSGALPGWIEGRNP